MSDLPEHDEGTMGLVIPCGQSHFNFAMHLVAGVRHVFKSSLPIEIMYVKDELTIDQRNVLESIATDVKTVNILNLFEEDIAGLANGGWAVKPFAILASSFQKVIVADSDAVFLQAPN